MHSALTLGLSSTEFWATTPRAILILVRVRTAAWKNGREDKKPKRLSYIPR